MVKRVILLAVLLGAVLAASAWQLAGLANWPAGGGEGTSSTLGTGAPRPVPPSTPGASPGQPAVPTARPTPPPPLEAAVRRAQKAWNSTAAFAAVATVTMATQGQTQTAQLRFWFSKPDRFRLQAIEPIKGLDGEGTTAVYDGNSLWTYLPTDQTVTIVDGPPSVLFFSRWPSRLVFPALQVAELPSLLAGLSQRDDLRLVGPDRVGGRPSVMIDIGAPAAGQGSAIRRVWFDADSGLPQRLQIDGPYGSPGFALTFVEMYTDVDLPGDLFTMETPTGANVQRLDPAKLAEQLGWHDTDLAAARAEAGFPLITLATPPAGFRQGPVRVASFGPQRAVAIWYTRSDGPDTILLETSVQAVPLDLPGTKTKLANGREAQVSVVGSTSIISWVQEQTALTLIGALPPGQAAALATKLAGQ